MDGRAKLMKNCRREVLSLLIFLVLLKSLLLKNLGSELFGNITDDYDEDFFTKVVLFGDFDTNEATAS